MVNQGGTTVPKTRYAATTAAATGLALMAGAAAALAADVGVVDLDAHRPQGIAPRVGVELGEEVTQAEPDDHQAKKMEVEASGSCYLDRENVDAYLNALFSSQKTTRTVKQEKLFCNF